MNVLDDARQIARDVAAIHAEDVDRSNRFPNESIDALREKGLLGYFIPQHLGGLGGDLATFSAIAAELGGACLSTGLIWVMHAHQVAVLAEHGGPALEPFVKQIAEGGILLASVTSEVGKGGDVLRAVAPLLREGDGVRVRREAPVVSYGAEAGLYLITMRTGPDRPETDVSLVLVAAADGGSEVVGDWDTMGLRGTRSVPMTFDLVVDESRMIPDPFRRLALRTLVPAAHIGWTAAWLGSARHALSSVVATSRRESERSESSLRSLAEARVTLDQAEALLHSVSDRFDELWSSDAEPEAYVDIALSIALNNVKVTGSRAAFDVVNRLIELTGMHSGYLRGAELERVFRDLRSASLMFSNHRLLDANALLMLVEGTPSGDLWKD